MSILFFLVLPLGHDVHGKVNVVWVVEDVDLVVGLNLLFISRVALTVDVDITPLLVCRQDEPLVGLHLSARASYLISTAVDDVIQMAALLHMILVPVAVIANVRDLLVLAILVVELPLLEIVVVVVLLIFLEDVVRVLLGDLQDDLVLLVQVVVVGINQHELVIVGHVVVLLNFLDREISLILDHDGVFLDEELWILMDKERG